MLTKNEIIELTIDGITNAVSGVVSAYSAWKGAAQLLGIENEKLAETMQTMQVATNAIIALQQIEKTLSQQSAATLLAKNMLRKAGLTLDKQQAVSTALNTTLTNLQTKSEQKGIIAKAGLKVATLAVTAAQWLWNAALMANPVILLVVAIAALVAGIAVLAKVFSKSAQAEKAAAKASAEYEKQAQKTAEAIAIINNTEKNISDERRNRLREEILEMQKNGATAEEIANARMKSEQDLRDISIQAAQDRIDQQKKELKASEERNNAELILLNTLLAKHGENSKKYIEQKKKVDELTQSHLQLAQTIKDGQQTIIDLNLQSAEAAQRQKEEDKKQQAERVKAYQSNALKTLDLQKKFQDEQYKLQDTYQRASFVEQQKYEAEKFASTQKYEQDKLDMQKRFGQITAAEYKKQNEILAIQEQTFQANQTASANKHYEEKRKEILGLLGDITDEQIADVNEKYAKAIKDLADMQEPVQLVGQSDEDFAKEIEKYKQFMFEKAAIETELEQQRTKEIEAIRQSSLEKQIADIEKSVSDQYKGDLAKFSDNEREKNRVEIEMLEKQIAEKKAKGLEVYEDEAALRSAQNKAIQLQLNTELLQANENAQAIYEAKKKALESERELYKDNADIQLEIARALADNEKALIDSRIAAFEEWSGKASELLSSISSIASSNEATEMQRYEEMNEKKKASLQSRLDSGLISQKEYDKQVAASDKELDKQRAELARKQAQREKLLRIFDIGINTASAIMKAAPNIPLQVATAILGATQLAAVVATPLPKASKGMLLKGKSHAQGGIPIEAEGGEAIINKRSTAMFAPLLSLINQVGGGVPFVPNRSLVSDGGYAMRANMDSGMSVDDMKDAFGEALKELKVYTAISEINDGQSNFSRLTENNPNFD